MPQRSLPGLGLIGFWDLGQDGWNTEHDANLRVLSALVQARVLSRTTALPGSPSDGQIYIVPSDAGANANRIAVRDNGAWVYIEAQSGYRAWVSDTSTFAYFNGSAWSDEVSGGGISDAPNDGKRYLRQSAAWTELPTNVPVTTYTGNRTAVIGDGGAYVRMDVSVANDFTVPPNSSVAFPIGTVIQLRQAGAGQTTIVQGSGVTVTTPETRKLRKQGASAALVKVGTDVWDLTGDLETL